MVKKQKQSVDTVYFLKLVLYLVIGSIWLKISDVQTWQVSIPVGLIIGMVFTAHEHFKIDRKIEYAVLLIATLIGFWAPIGLYINL